VSWVGDTGYNVIFPQTSQAEIPSTYDGFRTTLESAPSHLRMIKMSEPRIAPATLTLTSLGDQSVSSRDANGSANNRGDNLRNMRPNGERVVETWMLLYNPIWRP